jgi:ribosomal protein L11 methyltransferase
VALRAALAVGSSVPYRVDLPAGADDVLDRLVALGALDCERSHDGGLAALMPDSVTPERLARTLGVDTVSVSPAVARDAGSVWILSPRQIRIGRLQIVPADEDAAPGSLKLADAAAFGTGLHPTTALCLQALEEIVEDHHPDAVLDVGTGSGILALAALMLGVPRATAIDIDQQALQVAAENARLNALSARVQLIPGAIEHITGTWPLVLANVLAAPLIEMAPALVRHIGHHGRLVLSGIPSSVEQDVERAYSRLGMRCLHVSARAGWIALVLQTTW